MCYQQEQGTEFEDYYRIGCVRVPFDEASFDLWSSRQEMPEIVYIECFMMWLQVNQ